MRGKTEMSVVPKELEGWTLRIDLYRLRPCLIATPPKGTMSVREIVVPLYRKRDPIRVSAPVPPHMTEQLKACGWTEEMPSPVA